MGCFRNSCGLSNCRNWCRGGSGIAFSEEEAKKVLSEDEIEIRVTGLRPGEKLYEELATEEERKRRKKTANNKIWRLDGEAADSAKMQRMLSEIPSLTNNTVRAFLKENVPGYMPQKAVHL